MTPHPQRCDRTDCWAHKEGHCYAKCSSHSSAQSEQEILECKISEGACLKLCKCGNDTFRFIETADWVSEYECWEGDEMMRICTKCGEKLDCPNDAGGKSISRKTLAELRSKQGEP